MTPLRLLIYPGLALVSSHALAQTAAPPPATPHGPAASPAATTPPPTTSATPGTASSPPSVSAIEDAMLIPLPPPEHVVTSWRSALSQVRSGSTSRKMALAQIKSARGAARMALAAALPSLTGTGRMTQHLITGEGQIFTGNGLEATGVPNPNPAYRGALTLRQPLLALSTWHAHGTAKRRTELAERNAEETERVILAGVADALVTAVTTEHLAELSRVSLRAALSTLDLTRRRARLGAATALDILRAEQEVTLSRTQVVGSAESVRLAREALGIALGSDHPWSVDPSVSMDELARDAKGVCRSFRGIDERGDIRAAKLNADIAQRNTDGVKWRYAPTLDLQSDFTRSNSRGTLNNRPFQWSISALLTVPFFDGGSRYGEHTARSADESVAREQLTEARRLARAEVQRTQRGIQVATLHLKLSRDRRTFARESARLARLTFASGTGTSFDLVDAARRARESELDLALKEFDLVRAKITAFLAQANCAT